MVAVVVAVVVDGAGIVGVPALVFVEFVAVVVVVAGIVGVPALVFVVVVAVVVIGAGIVVEAVAVVVGGTFSIGCA